MHTGDEWHIRADAVEALRNFWSDLRLDWSTGWDDEGRRIDTFFWISEDVQVRNSIIKVKEVAGKRVVFYRLTPEWKPVKAGNLEWVNEVLEEWSGKPWDIDWRDYGLELI
jgi:hypothetical protein